MKSNYEKNKSSILKWRVNNIETYRTYQRDYARENYNDGIREKKRIYYEANKEKKHAYYLSRKQRKIEIQEDIDEIMHILMD